MPKSKNLIILSWIIALLVGAALSTRLPISRTPALVQRVYYSGVLHIIAHTMLYGVLAYLVAGQLWRTQGRARLGSWRSAAVLLFILLVGVAQEIVQAAVRGLHTFRPNEFFDLGVDLLGALLGLACFYLLRLSRTAPGTPRKTR